MMNYKRSWAYLIVACIILGIFLFWALWPEAVVRYEANQSFKPFLTPSTEHWLGTNDLGYDIFDELVKAASTTLTVGFAAALISIVIGSLIGLMAGYLPGIWGDIFTGVINIFMLIPMLPMVVVVSAFFGSSLTNIIIIIAFLGWCTTARAVRARVRQLKQMPFIESKIILGLPRRDIIFRHIFPNLKEVVSARYILSVAGCMLTEASVSFMGLGDPTRVTWGSMINFAFKRGGFVGGLVHWYLTPGLCIMLSSLSFFLINLFLEKRKINIRTNYLE